MAGHAEGGAGALPGRKLLALLPLGVSQVPRHPELGLDQHSPPGVGAFVTQCLNEANEEDFSSFQKMGETKEMGVYIGDDIVLYMIFGFVWWRLEFTMSMGVL